MTEELCGSPCHSQGSSLCEFVECGTLISAVFMPFELTQDCFCLVAGSFWGSTELQSSTTMNWARKLPSTSCSGITCTTVYLIRSAISNPSGDQGGHTAHSLSSGIKLDSLAVAWPTAWTKTSFKHHPVNGFGCTACNTLLASAHLTGLY